MVWNTGWCFGLWFSKKKKKKGRKLRILRGVGKEMEIGKQTNQISWNLPSLVYALHPRCSYCFAVFKCMYMSTYMTPKIPKLTIVHTEILAYFSRERKDLQGRSKWNALFMLHYTKFCHPTNSADEHLINVFDSILCFEFTPYSNSRIFLDLLQKFKYFSRTF